MSVIQNIRDKYARWSVLAIAVALLGFILMDAFGSGNAFGNQSTTLGEVNGKKIDFRDFQQKLQLQEQADQQRNVVRGEAEREQLISSLWNEEVSSAILEEELEKLSIEVTPKEMGDMLYGGNTPQFVVQVLGNPQTGEYNPEIIQSVRRSKDAAQIQDLDRRIEYIESQRLVEKYTSLLAGSSYFPKWMLESQNSDVSQIANVSYVAVAYNTISDSAVKVTDEEISAYIKEHKDEFEQKNETRSISYVVFSGTATSADSAVIHSQLQTLKAGFASATDNEKYLTQHEGQPYSDVYVTASKLTMAAKDSFISAPVGSVVGPYLEGENYMLAKKVDQKILPDSAKARHILVQTADPNAGQQLLDDSVGKRRIDSVKMALNAGVPFDSLVIRYSDDAGSKDKGGVYDYFAQGRMVKAFNDFVFTKPVGTRDVVKTEFGYHLIEVLGHKGSQMNYKVAYLPRKIVPSVNTENAASLAATAFSSQATDQKSFDAEYEKTLKNKGINKMIAANIGENDYTINGLGTNRALVRSVFDADKGDVIAPQKVGDDYVVALVTEISEKGLQTVEAARATVEPILRNKKKADMIVKKFGKITTLEAASAAVGQPVQTADTLRFAGTNPGLGFEMKVVGAAHNPANRGKVLSQPLVGQSGVYAIQVNSTGTIPNPNANIKEQQEGMRRQSKQMIAYRSPIEALIAAADIEDNRAEFY